MTRPSKGKFLVGIFSIKGPLEGACVRGFLKGSRGGGFLKGSLKGLCVGGLVTGSREGSCEKGAVGEGVGS